MAYVYFPPSPTPSMTPTITPTPTITLTPTITVPPTMTLTPSVSDTPTPTLTPFLPVAIESLFQGEVTPNPDAVFTSIQFSTTFDGTNPIDPKSVFNLPIKTMYGGFDYNNIIPGVQWTALWYHDGKLICYETKPWDGGTGGIGGYTECSDPVGGWSAGQYEVQIFMGYEWKVIGRFIVNGASTTPTLTGTPTAAKVNTLTATP
jgi:type VI secretion system secreted protein VgrG